MYSNTYKTYGAFNAVDSYSWIWEDLDKEETRKACPAREDLREWATEIVENSKMEDIRRVAEDEDTDGFPRFGYTTAQVFETPEEWEKFKLEEIEEAYADEVEAVMSEIYTWISSTD